jgi:hypothetical protein
MNKFVIIYVLLIVVLSCKKNKTAEPTPANPKVAPAKALLNLPSQNEICTSGSVISSTKSQVTFKWEKATNATSYDLVYKDLITQKTTILNTTNKEIDVILERNTAYSWYVISKTTLSTDFAQSEVWRFYNSGPGIVSYAPFPAEIIKPIMGELITAVGGNIILDWTGADVDNDIVSYDIYFGTTAQPILFKSDVVASELENISVVSGITYYWKVISRDKNNNISDSGIFQFKVK